MTPAILKAVLEGYSLPWDGTHGLRHWGRVLENGLRLAEITGADVEVIRLFSVFHDCRRINEGTDPGHGHRGAELAVRLYGSRAFALSTEQFAQLCYACERHTDGLTRADPTVQTCWDADRLDLGRVSVAPRPAHLCTAAARNASIIEWAEERSRSDHQPSVVDRWLAWAESAQS